MHSLDVKCDVVTSAFNTTEAKLNCIFFLKLKDLQNIAKKIEIVKKMDIWYNIDVELKCSLFFL